MGVITRWAGDGDPGAERSHRQPSKRPSTTEDVLKTGIETEIVGEDPCFCQKVNLNRSGNLVWKNVS